MIGESDEERRVVEAVSRMTIVSNGLLYVDVGVIESVSLGLRDVLKERGVADEWADGADAAICSYEDLVQTILYNHASEMVPDDIKDME